MQTSFRLSLSHPGTVHQSTLSVCVRRKMEGGGGVAENVQSLKEAGTNGSIRQNTVNKRDERWKHPFFFFFFSEALQLMSGQKVTVCIPAATLRLKEPSQQQLSPRFHSAFILRCNYSGGLGALWALSGGATPSTASESVLSTISPRCAHYTFKKKEMMVFSQNTLSDYNLTLQLRNSSAPNQCLWLNTACRLLSEPAETSLL